MFSLRRLGALRLTSDVFDIRVAQALFFLAAPALLVVGLRGLTRLAVTPSELFLGVVGVFNTALLLVVLATLLPLTRNKPQA